MKATTNTTDQYTTEQLLEFISNAIDPESELFNEIKKRLTAYTLPDPDGKISYELGAFDDGDDSTESIEWFDTEEAMHDRVTKIIENNDTGHDIERLYVDRWKVNQGMIYPDGIVYNTGLTLYTT